jgi:transcriptional regulator with XRE-family HTH domain
VRSHSAEAKVIREILREERMAAGLTQIELAKRLSAPQSFVSKYESGERRIDVLELRRIALALNTSLARLVSKFEERLGGTK